MNKENSDIQYRQKMIRELLSDLHAGKSFEEVKAKFAQAFQGVSASEIAEAERGLVEQGVSIEEITKLCDVHASVFRGSIQEIHRESKPRDTPGHPAHTLLAENQALEKLINEKLQPGLDQFLKADLENPSVLQAASSLQQDLKALADINVHYVRKEHLFFPYLERHGITAPPKVMWAVHDEIRGLVKKATQTLDDWLTIAAKTTTAKDVFSTPTRVQVAADLNEVIPKLRDMIVKENEILLPMALDTLTDEEWAVIAKESGEIGYLLIPEPPQWGEATGQDDSRTEHASDQTVMGPGGTVLFPTGSFKYEELSGVLNTVPFDLTFIDKDDVTRYFSRGAERIFPRTKAIIGRHVEDCHPPASVHIVQGIIDDFKAGRKDREHLKGQYVLISFFAVRGESGEYLGVVEVTQDLGPLQAIKGEKRLVQE